MAGTKNLLEHLRGVYGDNAVVDIEEGDSTIDVAQDVRGVFGLAAADLVNNTKGTVLVPAGRYVVKSTVTLPRDVHLLMEGVFVYDDDGDEPILVVGEDDYANQSILLRLAVERSATHASDWTSHDNIGIKLVNCLQCDINIVRANANTIGLQCIGVGTSVGGNGFMWNTIRLGKIMDNHHAIDCTGTSTWVTSPEAKLNIGCCNQNTFIGGRLGVSSTYQTGRSRYGVIIYAKDYDYQHPGLSYNTHNNNRFINTSFELSPPGGVAETLPVYIKQGWYNHFEGVRNETSETEYFMRVTGQSILNDIVTGYGSCLVQDLCQPSAEVPEAVPSTAYVPSTSHLQQPAKGTWSSGPLYAIATAYRRVSGNPDVDYIMIPGLFLSKDEGQGGSDNRHLYLDGYTLGSESVDFNATRAIGISLRTQTRKRFVVRRAFLDGYPGRVRIRCYNAGDQLLGGEDPFYCTGLPKLTLRYWDNRFGGCYQFNADSSGDAFFTVHEDVAAVDVLITGGTEDVELQSFTIESVDGGTPGCFLRVGLPHDPHLRLAVEAPQFGHYTNGTRVYHASPSSGQPQGWVLTGASTWAALPNL